jgi:hypothetical protein
VAFLYYYTYSDTRICLEVYDLANYRLPCIFSIYKHYFPEFYEYLLYETHQLHDAFLMSMQCNEKEQISSCPPNSYSLGSLDKHSTICHNSNALRIDVSGTWITNWTGAPVKMHLTQQGNIVTGTYEFNEGKIIGVLTGNVLEGAWISNNAGNFKFTFSPDVTSFKGTWGFGKASAGGGSWSGRRITIENLNVTGFWQTNYNEMYLEQKGNSVVGSYNHYNGRVEGVLNENTLIGSWYEDRNNDGKLDTNGNFRFTFALDNTFKGSRGLNESYTNEGEWNGKKSDSSSQKLKPPKTLDVTGTWNTNFNKMVLQQTGYNVSGNFDYNNGKLVGVIYGNTMTGTWYQDPDNNGTYESTGKFIFVFAPDGTSFKGTWGYGESFTNGSLWNGTKVS